MKKIIYFLIFVAIVMISGFFLWRNHKYNKIVEANVEFLCYQEVNRFTTQHMIRDRDNLTADEVKVIRDKVKVKDNEIAQKYGFKSGEDVRKYISRYFSSAKIEKMIKEVEKAVQTTCDPNYKYIDF